MNNCQNCYWANQCEFADLTTTEDCMDYTPLEDDNAENETAYEVAMKGRHITYEKIVAEFN